MNRFYKIHFFEILNEMFAFKESVWVGLLLLYIRVDNEQWVLNQIVHILESDELGYKLCIHNRDFVPGFTIMKNICTAIQHSRRLISVVTR